MPKVELKRWFSLVLAMEVAISRRQTVPKFHLLYSPMGITLGSDPYGLLGGFCRNGRLAGSLCCQPHFPNFLQDAPKMRLRSDAHGSIGPGESVKLPRGDGQGDQNSASGEPEPAGGAGARLPKMDRRAEDAEEIHYRKELGEESGDPRPLAADSVKKAFSIEKVM
jgi:hypothetical protein